MSNSIKAILIIVIVAAVSVVSYVVYLWPHLWWRVGTDEACVRYATVYKSSDGDLLFWFQADSLVNTYIFDRATNELGTANENRFNFVLPGLLYLKDPIVRVEEKRKYENIVIENETIHFPRWGCRIDLKSYQQ